MRPELEEVVAALLQGSAVGDDVSIDAVAEALGGRAASADEIEAIFVQVEEAGRNVVGPQGARGEARLRRVVETARLLLGELGRTATTDEIAARAGLTPDEVRHALALAQVMQR